jgi:sodium transport system ATP-binding protein
MLILVEELSKVFGGSLAVAGVSFRVAPGEVYGLLGPNGAGKTTTLRMLAGLMRPSGGRAAICGHDIEQQPHEAKRNLGFQTGSTGLYERLTPPEVLTYFGRLFGVERTALRSRVEELIETLGVGRLRARRCGSLSTGEKQRVSLARAMVHDPQVLIFDEPTAGLDVVASRFVADVVTRARERGRAVLLSTHYMAEAELLCDRIGLLHHGRLLREGTPEELKAEQGARSLEEAFLRLITEETESSNADRAVGRGEAPPRSRPSRAEGPAKD